MTKIEEYGFTTTCGIVASFTHHPESSRLKIDIKERDGTCNTLHFNSIGESTDPLDFIESMDWDYIKGKIFGSAGRTPDFLKTVSSTYTMMHDYANYGMEPEVVANLTHILKRTMAHYDGDDELACTIMVSSMRHNMDLDDCHHLIEYRDSDRVIDYRDNVWGPLYKELGNFVGFSPFGQVEEEDELELEM